MRLVSENESVVERAEDERANERLNFDSEEEQNNNKNSNNNNKQ